MCGDYRLNLMVFPGKVPKHTSLWIAGAEALGLLRWSECSRYPLC